MMMQAVFNSGISLDKNKNLIFYLQTHLPLKRIKNVHYSFVFKMD